MAKADNDGDGGANCDEASVDAFTQLSR